MTADNLTSDLVDAVRAAVQSLPAGHVESLARAIDKLPCFSQAATGSVLSAVASPTYRNSASVFLDSWGTAPDVPGLALALALRAAAGAQTDTMKKVSVEVVWTGPTSHEIPVRRTREVLLDLIERARRRLLVVSFAAYRVPEIVESLSTAALRGVNIRLILETSADSYGRLSHDAAEAFEAVRRYADFYTWPSDKRQSTDGSHGALHAKAVLVDGSVAFVTSANLTGHALTSNMELGVLIRGGVLPERLTAHFDELVAHGVLKKLR